jgi:rare lipoprotein A
MSVSFLVEARDVPADAQVVIEPQMDFIGPPLPQAFALDMDDIEDGMASWYGPGFHGRRTASGRRYDMDELTAAHPTLPFGTIVVVEYPRTGERVAVEITDRGPYIKPRVIDLSRAAARTLKLGVGRVDLVALRPEMVKDFYDNNDSTVVALSADFQPLEMPVVATTDLVHHRSYSAAVRAMQCDEVIIVGLDERDRPAYATAKIKAIEMISRPLAGELASAQRADSPN